MLFTFRLTLKNLGKNMNPHVLPSVFDKYKDRLVSFPMIKQLCLTGNS